MRYGCDIEGLQKITDAVTLCRKWLIINADFNEDKYI